MKEARDVMKLQGTIKELFSVSIYRRNLILLMTIWSYGAFSFFLIPYYLATVKSNVFLMSTATAVAEIVASGICWFITECLQIKSALSIFSFISCVSAVAITLFNTFYV